MAALAYLGGVQPSEYRSMPWRDAKRLERALVKIRKDEIDFEVTLAKIASGLKYRR